MRVVLIILLFCFSVAAQTDAQKVEKLSKDLAAAITAKESLEKQIEVFGKEREAFQNSIKSLEAAKLSPCVLAWQNVFDRLDTYYTELLKAPNKKAERQIEKKAKLARKKGGQMIESSCPTKGWLQKAIGL